MSTYKTIAKNTIFLYLRMFFTMIISLYASRLVLQVLGIEDFGIYNLVGGVVVLFSFLNAAMSSTTQRYINMALSSKIIEDVRKVFSVSVNVHLIISIIIIILAETVGLWFLNYKLVIPDNRMYAANMVYQISIITTIIEVMQVPYNAMILAYEKFSFFAFLGIFECVAKLAVVGGLLFFSKFDHLILYSIMLAVVYVIIYFIYYLFCRKNFEKETTYKKYKDKTLFKELVSFSGWMLLGSAAVVGANQGLNMILNIFIGVAVNATMGIANQVNNAIFSFVANFQTAFRPQVIQSYARNELDLHKKMILNTSKYSFFLMTLLSAPILFFGHYILILWLGDPLPPYIISFIQIIILVSLIDSLSGPFWMSAQAIGNIKVYNVVLTSINLLVLPLGYLLLYFGYNPVSILIGKFCISVINQFFRYYFINKYLHFDKKEFFSYSVAIFIPFAYLIVLVLFCYNKKLSFLEFVGGTSVLEIVLLIIIIAFGINREDRKMIQTFIKNKIKK